MVSKALVIGAYQRKPEELAALPGMDLTVVVPSSWRDGRETAVLQRAFTHGYRLIVAPLVFNGQYHFHFYPGLGRLVHALRPDIVHMDEEPYNLATWQALRAAEAAAARSLFFTWQNLPRRYPWPFGHFETANYRRAAYAIAGNQDAVGVLRGKGYAGPVSVIPQFGVDPEIYAPEPARPGSAMRSEGFTVGYSGRLVPEKGVDLLLRACAALPMKNWTLLILGHGPERDHLEVLAGELPGVQEHVRFLGRLPSTEMPAFYRRLDVLVLPSRSQSNWIEQFGRVLIEAMACAVPVVGSTCGEIPRVIGDPGLVFPEGDVDALCASLMALAGDSARRAELGQAGRARVLAHFTQAQVAAATYRIYQEMLQARH
jgi:glycosyltransferase involved in cell wall biosynthesis